VKVIFIGTGSGKVSLKRFHSSILVSEKNSNLLIDAGDSISRALLNLNIDINSIDNILISHNHADHYSGIASLVTQMKLLDRSKPLKIFTHELLSDNLKLFLNSSYMFEEILGFKLEIIGYNFNTTININSNLRITPRQNSHITNKHNLTDYKQIAFVSSSFLIDNHSKQILYTSDVGSKKDLYLFKNFNLDYLITEFTHISLKEIKEAAEELNPKKIYLTHIEESAALTNDWNKLLNKSEQKKFIIAYDGLQIEL